MRKYFLFLFLCSYFYAGCKLNNSYSTLYIDTDNSYNISVDNRENHHANLRKGYTIVKTSTDLVFDITAKIQELGGEICNSYSISSGYTYMLVYSKKEDASFRAVLNKTEGIAYAEPDYSIDLPRYNFSGVRAIEDSGDIKNDPEGYNHEYALRVTKARDWYNESGNLQAGAYRKVGYGNQIAVAAIIDTGINMKHTDFVDNGNSIVLYAKSSFNEPQYWGAKDSKGNFTGIAQYKKNGKNALREISIGENEDGDAHGTHCSGTICAVGDNGKDIAGVAYKNVRLISYKGLANHSGSVFSIYGSLYDLADIVEILKKEPSIRTQEEKERIPQSVPSDFVITQKTVPVNMSLGGNGPTSYYSIEAFNYALSVGVLPVIAMGNEGRTITANPAAVQGVMSVGATTAMDKKADFSNSGSWISVCAPGHNIISCANGNWVSNIPANDIDGVKMMSGTSMAAPFVTGTLAYLLSFDEARSLTPYQLKSVLELTADQIDSHNTYFGYFNTGYNHKKHSDYYGYGRVNVLEAAKCITGMGDVQIPAEGENYTEKTVSIKLISHYSYPMIGINVYLYDDKNVCVGIGITNNQGIASFKGLTAGKNYVAKVNSSSNVQEVHITPDKYNDINETIQF